MRLIRRVREIGSQRQAIKKSLLSAGIKHEHEQALLLLLRVASGLARLLEKKMVSVERLKRLFAKKTESSGKVLRQINQGQEDEEATAGPFLSLVTATGNVPENSNKKPRKKGHGRLGVDAYAGAPKVVIKHECLKSGELCPKCRMGKIYWHPCGQFLKLQTQGLIQAMVYLQEKLRCNGCGAIFSARMPAGVADTPVASYSARALVCLLRYGFGMPNFRLSRLQQVLGVPLPCSTQWDLIKAVYQESVTPIWKHLIWFAAQGEVMHNDDTNPKVLELVKEINGEIELEKSTGKKASKNEGEHRKVYTSGILSLVGTRQVLLLFTGRAHAGDNLTELLKLRDPMLAPPIQMADMLSSNTVHVEKGSGELAPMRAGCMSHARRMFLDCYTSFRGAVTHVVLELKIIFKNEAVTKKQRMTDDERLAYHQDHSGPIAEKLKNWFEAQFTEKNVEPNSELGKAITYCLNHWEELSLFLKIPGAPLTNDALERQFKPAKMHLNNSLFYQTVNGARVGDANMSLIQTVILNGDNPFEYFVAIQENAREVNEAPARWLPWNWRETLAAKTAKNGGQKPMVLATGNSRR